MWASNCASHLEGSEEPPDVLLARGLHDRFLVLVQDRADVLDLQPSSRLASTRRGDGERFCTFNKSVHKKKQPIITIK